MTPGPSVAAVVPTRNRADRMEAAVRSVLDQTYGDVEVVVVDGGSTDRTPDAVEALRRDAGDTEITYLRNEEPRGPSVARNQGVAATDADYVGFLDDDDRWHPEKVERQLQRLGETEGDVGAVYCWVDSVRRDGSKIHTRTPDIEGDVYRDLLVHNWIGTPSTLLIEREAYESVGGFDESIEQHEDWDLYIRLAEDHRFVFVPEPLVTRLYHEGGRSRDIGRQRRDRGYILNRHSQELKELGLEDRAWAIHHRETGIKYCLNGDTAEGRKEFRKSLKHERAPYTYALLLAATLGPRGFGAVTEAKRRIAPAFQ